MTPQSPIERPLPPRMAEPPAPPQPLDLWVRRTLQQRYEPALDEAIPDELRRLAEMFPRMSPG